MAAPPDAHADAVVVGAGHNGLVAAAYLARAGLRVVVCERRDVLGGATVTEELAPGYRVSTASYALSLLRPDVLAELELPRHGLTAVAKDPQMYVPLPAGGEFFVWRDAAKTRESIGRISPADADAYPRWASFWEAAAHRLRPALDEGSPDAASLRAAAGEELWRQAVEGSAAELVERFFVHPGVQGAFVTQGVIGTFRGPREEGTAWVMTYHALGGELYGSQGTWGYVRGGMGALAAAVASSARAAGAELRTGAEASEVLVEDGRAAGVRLAAGAVVRAPIVVSGADPKTTFLRLLAPGTLTADFERRVAGWDTTGCVLKVNLAVSQLPAFGGCTEPGPAHRATVEIAPSIDYVQRAFEDASHTGWSREPFMEVFVQSAVDPTLTDGGGHVVSAFTQYVGPGAAGGDWTAVRERAAQAVLDALAARAPNITGSVVAVEALGPPELEARFGLAGGNIFHGELVPEQCFQHRFDHRSPVPGLYLGGSGSQPGGCVTGAAGRNVARVVLADLEAGRG